jgi:hypothetical protein
MKTESPKKKRKVVDLPLCRALHPDFLRPLS